MQMHVSARSHYVLNSFSCYIEEAGITYTSVTAIILSDSWVICSLHTSHSPPLISRSAAHPLPMQVVTAGDAFANFIDPAAPQPSALQGRLVALLPTASGLQVIVLQQWHIGLSHVAFHPQRVPLEFGLYVGAQAAEQTSWKPKMGSCTHKLAGHDFSTLAFSGGLAPYACRHPAASWMLAALHCCSRPPAHMQLQCTMSDATTVRSFLSASVSTKLGDSVRVLACPLSLLSITHFNSLLADGSLCCR